MNITNRRLLKLVCIFAVVLVCVFQFVKCSKTYEDSAYTDPVQPETEIVIVRYFFDRGEPRIEMKEFAVSSDSARGLISLFEDSQFDPQSMKWMSEGYLELIDDKGRVVAIELFSAGRRGPDIFRIDGIYYRKPALISALELWVTEHQELESPETEMQDINEEANHD